MESHQRTQYAAQEIPSGIKKSCSKFICNFLLIYQCEQQFVWVWDNIFLAHSCFPCCFSFFHSLTSYLSFPPLSPSLCFDVWVLRALAAELLFPSWLLSDGGVWTISKLEMESWHCLCGSIYNPTESGIFRLDNPDCSIKLRMSLCLQKTDLHVISFSCWNWNVTVNLHYFSEKLWISVMEITLLLPKAVCFTYSDVDICSKVSQYLLCFCLFLV